MTGYQSSLVRINNGHAKLFQAIIKVNKDKLPNVNVKARLIIPDGYKNYGYLAYKNFDSLLNWNRSNYFAIAVGTLADSIKENN